MTIKYWWEGRQEMLVDNVRKNIIPPHEHMKKNYHPHHMPWNIYVSKSSIV